MWPDTNVHAKRLSYVQETNAIRAILTGRVAKQLSLDVYACMMSQAMYRYVGRTLAFS